VCTPSPRGQEETVKGIEEGGGEEVRRRRDREEK
jgi:hypothetical protein